jgi:acyl carrier protein
MAHAATDGDGPAGDAVGRLVRELLGELAAVDPATLRPDARVGDLGLDSLDAAELLVGLEDGLGLRFGTRTLGVDWSAMTVAELDGLVRRELRS